MVTKEQAMTETRFIHVLNGKAYNWCSNGKCKTWKRNAERFQLPIKHGLYDYAYLTNENSHLFEVAP